MTTASETTRETVRAARMNSELLTTRVPSCSAAPSAVSVTARKYGLEHPRLYLWRGHGRDEQQDVALVERGMVLVEARDRMRELRVGDVVAPSGRDAGIVEPNAGAVVADDQHKVRHRPSRLLVMARRGGGGGAAHGAGTEPGGAWPTRGPLVRSAPRGGGDGAVGVTPMGPGRR